jgi:hypothetical protein
MFVLHRPSGDRGNAELDSANLFERLTQDHLYRVTHLAQVLPPRTVGRAAGLVSTEYFTSKLQFTY